MTDDWLKNTNERVEEWLTNNMNTADDDDGDDHEEEDSVVVDLTSDDDGGEDTGTKQPAVYEPSVDDLVKQIDDFLENKQPEPQPVCIISSITCGHCGYVFNL